MHDCLAELALRKGWSSSLGPSCFSAAHQLSHSIVWSKHLPGRGLCGCKRNKSVEPSFLPDPAPRTANKPAQCSYQGASAVPSLWAAFAFLLGQRALSHPVFFPSSCCCLLVWTHPFNLTIYTHKGKGLFFPLNFLCFGSGCRSEVMLCPKDMSLSFMVQQSFAFSPLSHPSPVPHSTAER